MRKFLILAAAATICSSAVTAETIPLPTFDIREACHTAINEAYASDQSIDVSHDYDQCIALEKESVDKLNECWPKLSEYWKLECSSFIKGQTPLYSMLLGCVEGALKNMRK